MIKKTAVALVTASILPPAIAQAEEPWTGFYFGGQVGASRLSAQVGDALEADSDTSYGLFAGYDKQFGNNFVIGGEIDLTEAGYKAGGISGDVETVRAKFRAGYAFGPSMVYGTVGAAHFDDGNSHDKGTSLGIGYSYITASNTVLGVEYLVDDFDGFGKGASAETLNFRASFKF